MCRQPLSFEFLLPPPPLCFVDHEKDILDADVGAVGIASAEGAGAEPSCEEEAPAAVEEDGTDCCGRGGGGGGGGFCACFALYPPAVFSSFVAHTNFGALEAAAGDPVDEVEANELRGGGGPCGGARPR